MAKKISLSSKKNTITTGKCKTLKALEELIRTHRGRGADVSEDMGDSEEYTWENNRLIGINWDDKNLSAELDVSNCTSLEELSCSSYEQCLWDDDGNLICEGLTSVNGSGCTSLKTLRCDYNQLISLDLSNNPNLSYLHCDDSVNVISYNK